MPYTAPTAADFKTRFPVFVLVADPVIDGALNEAALKVDDCWLSQADFTLGRLLYAAHVLTIDGHGTSAEAQSAASGTTGFQTIKSGDLTLTRFTPQQTETQDAASDVLGSTSYGRRFLEIQALNVGGPIVVP